MFSAQKKELSNPRHPRTTLKVTGKEKVTMEFPESLFAAFLGTRKLPLNHREAVLASHFFQLERYFEPAQLKPFTGEFCNSRGSNMKILYSQIGCLKSNTACLKKTHTKQF